ncbi:esterase family protein [Actinomadura sp. ATCC 31491]|uniref:Esterase family protein n=1 Tax=Actinomadura luzonensis TaxID=2805427 RepID=A0ABT0FSB8_9ACTN|nr:alpha/beta hydrolase family protein [Actinomadura luzonensis]MCK2215239.1 esterase family protein [Actinomadura luzonensis]
MPNLFARPLAALALLLTLAQPAWPATAATAPGVVETVVKEGRVLDLTITSPLINVPGRVRLLLPPGYSKDAAGRWPVLWLLHGGGGSYTDWDVKGAVDAIVGDRQVLVVMPDSGPCSGYVDWKDPSLPPRKWESFHMGELYDLLRNEYRAGDQQAIAGLSMGGGGAVGYAEHYPGRFRAAASFSGALDLDYPGGPGLPAMVAIQSGATACGVTVEQIYGPVGGAYWNRYNPARNAEALRGTRLYIATGDGQAGTDASGAGNPVLVDVVEQSVYGMAARFTDQLGELDIPARVHFKPFHRHDWVNWQGELRRSLDFLLRP